MNDRLMKAIVLATQAHQNDHDKLGNPYILHPMAVMLDPELQTDDEKIVAILHDFPEEHPEMVDWMAIWDMFGTEVYEALKAITHLKGESNITYWNKVKADQLALKIKLADIRYNISESRLSKLDSVTQERLRAKYRQALEVLTSQQ